MMHIQKKKMEKQSRFAKAGLRKFRSPIRPVATKRE